MELHQWIVYSKYNLEINKLNNRISRPDTSNVNNRNMYNQPNNYYQQSYNPGMNSIYNHQNNSYRNSNPNSLYNNNNNIVTNQIRKNSVNPINPINPINPTNQMNSLSQLNSKQITPQKTVDNRFQTINRSVHSTSKEDIVSIIYLYRTKTKKKKIFREYNTITTKCYIIL